MIRIVVLFLSLSSCLSVVLLNETDDEFQRYMKKFHKSYKIGSEEYYRRKDLYFENLQRVKTTNNIRTMQYPRGLPWSVEVNAFTDMTKSEFRNNFLGYRKEITISRKNERLESVFSNEVKMDDLPKQVDWREKGVVTPVKAQGGCGSCWAFATTQAVESHFAISTGILVELSEQQLISCVKNPNHCGGTGGCAGSTMELGFEWVRDNGLYTEWEYPYESFTGTVPSCDNGTIYPLAAIKNFTLLPSNDYESVIRALAMKGPLAISVDASEWGSYKKGVFNGCNTKNPDINHGVLLVGYGEDEETKEPYWLIKNSWGPIWGEKGYIRIRRDVNGTVCGVDTSPAHGIACEGSGITSMKVCGTCGVLFDASFPTGVYIHED